MYRIITVLAILLLPASLVRGSGFSIYEASVRANGMLGAFSAYADHVSTIYYNPAGLAKLDGFRLSGGATVISPRTSFRGPIPYSDTKYEMEEQNFFVPNFYTSYQISEGLTVGLGGYVPFGLGTKWEDNWVGNDLAIETSIETFFLNPTVGYTLPELGIGDIHIGAGVLVGVMGEVKLSRRVSGVVPSDNFELAADGFDNTPVGFNAGLLYEPHSKVTLGFTYRSSIETEFEGDANFNKLPQAAFPPGIKGSTSIELPPSWVAALNVKPMPNLTVEVDYVWWGWSSYDELVIEFDQTVPALGGNKIVSERDYNDVWQLRGGVEYSKFGVKGLVLRGGIAYDKNPIPDRTLDPTLPDSDRLLFSGGLTYNVNEMIAIDAGYIFIRAEERKNTSAEHGLDGVYNTYANLPSLGITLKL